MFLNADFPLADKIAKRLRRKIENTAPYLLQDGGTSPQIAQMQEALKQSQGQIGELIQKLAEKNLELKDKQEDRNIRAYEAESHRLTAETNAIVDLQNSQQAMNELMQTIVETLKGMKEDVGNPIVSNSGPENPMNDEGDGSFPLIEDNDIPPFEGAIKAPDGNWHAVNRQ
jgi:hypothetical protein